MIGSSGLKLSVPIYCLPAVFGALKYALVPSTVAPSAGTRKNRFVAQPSSKNVVRLNEGIKTFEQRR